MRGGVEDGVKRTVGMEEQERGRERRSLSIYNTLGLKLAVMFEGSQDNKFAHHYSHHMGLLHFSSVLVPSSGPSVSRIFEDPSPLSLRLELIERAPVPSPRKNTISWCPHRGQAEDQHLHLVPLRKGRRFLPHSHTLLPGSSRDTFCTYIFQS